VLTRERQQEGNTEALLPADSVLTDTQLQTLRYLLLGPEYQRLLEHGLNDEDHDALAQRLAPVLSKALGLADQEDRQLEKMLNPLITKSLISSVSENPVPVADALYPVMGPAIRKSISQSIEGLLNNFNTLLENSLSPRSMKWRFDAWRTGRPFAEVALLNTLEYQVEQVFLIHKKTGLPIRHMVSATAISKDPDLVSGMLTAIQDFIHDSFTTENDSGLDVLKLGRLTVLLEQGPHAVLACVVRGTVAQELQSLISEVLEDVHNNGKRNLQLFNGDTQQWDFLETDLARCLQSKRRVQEQQQRQRKKNKPLIPLRYWVLLGLLAPLLWLAFTAYKNKKADEQIANTTAKLNNFFQSEPGLILTGLDYQDGIYRLHGLADPLATAPEKVARRAVGGEKIHLQFKPYQALEPHIVIKRLRRNFTIPVNVKLILKKGTLYASGVTRSTRIKRQLSSLGPLFPGVHSVNITQLKIAPTAK